MKSRTIAIAGSIAALSFAALPVAGAAAATHHAKPTASSIDRSRDRHGVRHADPRSVDTNTRDRSVDSTLDR